MAGTYVVFHHCQFLWAVPLGMMVVFINPCLDEVTHSCPFAVQVTSFISNGKRLYVVQSIQACSGAHPTSYSVMYRGCVHW